MKILTTLAKGLLTSLTVFLGSMTSAQAYTAEFDGTLYDFSVVTGTYSSVSEQLEQQFWFGLGLPHASNVVNAVSDQLGTPNRNGTRTPYAVYSYLDGDPAPVRFAYWTAGGVATGMALDSAPLTWLVATPSSTEPTAVPEIDGKTLPLLVFLLGVTLLGLRRARQRVDLPTRLSA